MHILWNEAITDFSDVTKMPPIKNTLYLEVAK